MGGYNFFIRAAISGRRFSNMTKVTSNMHPFPDAIYKHISRTYIVSYLPQVSACFKTLSGKNGFNTNNRLRLVSCNTTRQISTKTDADDFSLKKDVVKEYVSDLVDRYNYASEKVQDGLKSRELLKDINDLRAIVELMTTYTQKEKDIKEMTEMLSDIGGDDKEMTEMAQSELQDLEAELAALDKQVMASLIPPEGTEQMGIILDITAGAGGQESMMFAEEMLDMYAGYAQHNHWQFEVIRADQAPDEGYRHVSASVKGLDVYRQMQFEGGVHRVQRVPKTETKGRIHTSTVAVAIMPLPSEIEVELHPKDIEMTTMRSSGPGGQLVNKINSCVRLVHKPTGIVAECQETRQQIKNKEIAMEVLRSRIFEKLRKEKDKDTTDKRKRQVGQMDRSEKIRTYNFIQDRISDHRIRQNYHGVESFLSGNEDLGDLHFNLFKWSSHERLKHEIEEFEKERQSEEAKTGKKQ